jgi:hypothetical protein
MTTRASGDVAPRKLATNRRTLAYRAVKPWSSTRSCQMAIALRPWARAVSMRSWYGAQALALGARPGVAGGPESVDTSAPVAGFASESVDTTPVVAGFGGGQTRGRPPRMRTGMPAARR